jgi:hypothetical protein
MRSDATRSAVVTAVVGTVGIVGGWSRPDLRPAEPVGH